jgi:hypothetical protein
MSVRLVILYEDARGPRNRFPLHDLLVRSAADLTDLPIHDLTRRVIAVPKNGVNKVLGALPGEGLLYKQHSRVLAWLDNDRIREALQLPKHTARTAVIAKVKALAPQPGHGKPPPVKVFLLDDNLEDLLSRVAPHLDPAILGKARKKHLDARDMLLDDIARNPALRTTLRAHHAGFDCVSRFVACVATTEPWPP